MTYKQDASEKRGSRCNTVVHHLPSKIKAIGSTSNTEKICWGCEGGNLFYLDREGFKEKVTFLLSQRINRLSQGEKRGKNSTSISTGMLVNNRNRGYDTG